MQVNWDPYLFKKCNPSGDEPASWEGTLTSQEMDLVIQMDVSVMQPPGNRGNGVSHVDLAPDI